LRLGEEELHGGAAATWSRGRAAACCCWAALGRERVGACSLLVLLGVEKGQGFGLAGGRTWCRGGSRDRHGRWEEARCLLVPCVGRRRPEQEAAAAADWRRGKMQRQR